MGEEPWARSPEPGGPGGGLVGSGLRSLADADCPVGTRLLLTPESEHNRCMVLSPFAVRATAGTLRAPEGVELGHLWTDAGVIAGPVTNGGQALHLAVALCVLNDTYREAERLGITVDGVAVEADGGFDDDWRSTGIEYAVTLDSDAPAGDLARLLSVVDEVAEIPRAVRAGATVRRRG